MTSTANSTHRPLALVTGASAGIGRAYEVVNASMIGLGRGEVVCIPTLEETDRLQHHDQAEADVLAANMRPSLAERYLS
jgi:NADP-dependent 3-hydroxy acid dehydrogenase YdfG